MASIFTVSRLAAGLAGLLLAVWVPPTVVWADDAQPEGKPAAGRDVFGANRIWPVHLTIPPREYEAMQPRGGGRGPFGPPPEPVAPLEPGREVHRNDFGFDLAWAKGSVSIGKETFENVGIRYKGNGTIFDTQGAIKKSFKIELDYFKGKGSFQGLKTLNLHCDVTDPTKLRETLGYALYREAGVPSPKTAFAEVRLTVPGKFDNELLGVYTLVEQVGKPFTREHFGTDKGLLMKPERLRDFVYQGDDWGRYKEAYQPKRDATAEEARRMMAFAKLVEQGDDAAFRKEIGDYLDLENYLRFLATTAFVANTDSFFGLGHNYYLYLHPKTKRIHFIPWDLDRAFANFGAPEQTMDLSLRHPYAGSHRLTERLLAIPEISARYGELLKQLAAGPFDRGRFLKELGTLSQKTGELIEREAQAAAGRKEERRGGGFGPFGRPPSLETFIEKRTESVKAQLAGNSEGFIPTGGPFGGGGPPGPPAGGFGRLGDLMPPPLQDLFGLSPEQRKKVAALQKEADAELDKLLTEEQRKQLKTMRERGPRGPGPGQPPGGPGVGGRPFDRPAGGPGN